MLSADVNSRLDCCCPMAHLYSRPCCRLLNWRCPPPPPPPPACTPAHSAAAACHAAHAPCCRFGFMLLLALWIHAAGSARCHPCCGVGPTLPRPGQEAAAGMPLRFRASSCSMAAVLPLRWLAAVWLTDAAHTPSQRCRRCLPDCHCYPMHAAYRMAAELAPYSIAACPDAASCLSWY